MSITADAAVVRVGPGRSTAELHEQWLRLPWTGRTVPFLVGGYSLDTANGLDFVAPRRTRWIRHRT